MLHPWVVRGVAVLLGLLTCPPLVRSAEPGALLWSQQIPVRSDAVPALSSDTLYLPLTNGALRAIDVRTGTVRWENSEANLGLRPVLTRDGAVLTFGADSQGNSVVALDAGTGTRRWRGASSYWNPAYEPFEPLVLTPFGTAVSRSRASQSMDLKTGQTLWVNNAPSRGGLEGVGPDGTLYAYEVWEERPPWVGGSWLYEGRWIQVDSRTGAVKGNGPVSRLVEATTGAWGADGTRSAVIVRQDIWWDSIPFDLVIENRHTALQGTGWESEIGARGGVALALDGDPLCTGAIELAWMDSEWNYRYTNTCRVARLARDTGIPRWMVTLTNRTITAPCLAADGSLWYATDQGQLVARSIVDGAVLQAIELPARPGFAPLLTTEGTLLVGCTNGQVLAYTGTVGPPVVSWWQANGTGDNSLALIWEGPPRFRGAVADHAVLAGDPLRLLPHAEGARPMRWQWFHDGVAIPGATNQEYVVASLDEGGEGRYQVTAENAFGQATGQIAQVRRLYRLDLGARGQGEIRQSPVGTSFRPGSTVELRAVPRGGQRFLGWTDTGDTNPVRTLSLTNHQRLRGAFSAEPGGLRWSVINLGAIKWAPAWGPDTAYVVTSDPQAIAIQTLGGELRWVVSLPSVPTLAPVLATPDTLLIAAGNAVLSLATVDGRLRWNKWTTLQGRIEDMAVDGEGRVVVTSNPGELVALDIASGTELWRSVIPSGFSTSLALGARKDLFVGAGRLTRVDRTTGALAWQREFYCITKLAIGADYRVYVGDSDQHAVCVHGLNGEIRWRVRLPGLPAAKPLGAPIIAENGWVLWNLANGATVALDPETGDLRAQNGVTKPGWWPWNVHTVARGNLVLHGTDTLLTAWDAPSGRDLWQSQLPSSWGGVVAQPLYAPDGGIYVGGTDGTFNCFDSGAVGEVVSAWPSPGADVRNSGRLAPDYRRPWLVAGRGDTTIEVRFTALEPGIWVLEASATPGGPDWQTVQTIPAGVTRMLLPKLPASQFLRLRRE